MSTVTNRYNTKSSLKTQTLISRFIIVRSLKVNHVKDTNYCMLLKSLNLLRPS